VVVLPERLNEVKPVPPLPVGRVPVILLEDAIFKVPKAGAVIPPTLKSGCPAVPAAEALTALVPLPYTTPYCVNVVAPVPPLPTGKVPVTPVVSGSPVPFVNVIAEGVSRFGVVRLGDVLRTTEPVPVDDVTPVPPLATGRVPVTPDVRGRPVALVKVAAEGVPKFGVTKAAFVANEIAPEPFTAEPSAVWTPVPNDVIPVPPLATGRVPVTPDVRGRPVALVKVAAEGVPKFGVTKVAFVVNEIAPEPFTAEPSAV